MRVVVVGAHGRTGKLIVDQLLAARDEVVATIRNPAHMAPLVRAGAQTVLLDLDSASPRDFAIAFGGAAAVVFAAGSGDNEPSAIDRKGVTRTVNAALKAGVKRYVAISAIGASTPVPRKWNTPEMKDYWAAKKAGNTKIRGSGLDWTIIEPGELTQGRPTGKVTLTSGALDFDGAPTTRIARADVAATVVAALRTPRTIGRTFQLVGGTTEIKKALAAASH